MKTTLYIIRLLLCLGVSACTPPTESLNTYPITVSGNQCIAYVCNNPHLNSRTIEEDTSLQNGSRISFYLKGVIETDTQLELENGIWKGALPDLGTPAPSSVDVTAVYPVLENPDNPYTTEGELTDVCYDEQTTAPHTIKLTFKHLFARLSIELSESLQHQLEYISIVPQQKITGISLFPLKLEYGNTDLPVTKLSKNTSGIYTLIIPPHESQTCMISLQMSDGKVYSTKISNQLIENGTHYYCKITSQEDGKGIFTTEDFIKFSELMFSSSGADKELEKFYTMENGVRVFHLRSDLVFTKEQSARLKRFGTASKYFNNVLNGHNHTISGIVLDKNLVDNTLIMYIGKNGVLENLILNEASIIVKDKYLSTGLLCIYNYGIIRNCKVKNCLIKSDYTTSQSNGGVGFICRNNYGTIYNCVITNSTIDYKNIKIGGITYSGVGTVLNCAGSNIDLSQCTEKGGLCYSLSEGSIHNCHIYDKGAAQWTKYGSLVYAINNGNISNCFSIEEGQKKAVYDTSGESVTGASLYPEAESRQTVEKLNQWIETTGKELYPDLNFKRWILTPEGIPTLQD